MQNVRYYVPMSNMVFLFLILEQTLRIIKLKYYNLYYIIKSSFFDI